MIITWEDALEAKAQGLAEGEARGLAEGEARGLAEGEARGLAEGETRGKLEATREAISLLLHRRFGEPASPIESALAEIDDLDRLHTLLERAIDARSIDELGLAS
jgi:flagellar biosynthesis/type III secretory pathway protein FliH